MTTVRLIQTSPDGKRLADVSPPAWVPELETRYLQPAIVLNPSVRYQTLLGFGGAFTESACWTLSHLSEDAQDEVLRRYFDPQHGLGYRFARTHINSCDFSLGNWACAETPGDTELEDFTLERTHRYITPMIQRARRLPGVRFDLVASPWSPPPWMKTSGTMNHGGKLKPEYRGAWAAHYVRWIEGMREQGVPTWGITIQNEPAAVQVWDSCIYTAEEERDFVRDFLGPALHAAGMPDVRIIIWDHNREIAFDRAATVLSDPIAARYVWGTGLHWYSGDFFDQLEQLHRAFPEHHLMFTEGCWEGGVKRGQYDRGERYAHHIIGDLNHYCEAWLDWNMVLDQTGGPNHVGNLCDAPVIVDTETREIHYQTSYYYMGHFSRYIQPGAQRIGRSYFGGALESTAFINADESLVLVVMNPHDEASTFRIIAPGGGVEATIDGHAIQTWVFEGT